MPEIDPTELDVPELTKEVQAIDDVEELEAILEAEEDGEARAPAITVIESRIDDLREEDEEVDPETVDLSELSTAEVANMVREVDDVELLEDILDRETEGENRESAIAQIENRIDSVQGSEEGEEVYQSPEEKYPELDHPTAEKRWVEGTVDGEYRDMWVFCETQAGQLVDVSKEMLGKARELMDDYNEQYDAEERVVAVLIGEDVSEHVEDVVAYGADVVVYQEDPRLERFRLKPYTEIFCDMARGDADWRDYHEPRYTVFPATNNGRDLSATVQGELDSGLASDCSGLYIDSAVISNPAKTGEATDKKEFERVLHMKRPDFSGFEYSTILCLDKPNRDFHPQGASVIPGSFDVPSRDGTREAETVIEYDCDLDDEWFRVKVTEHDRLDEGVDLTGHEVVVCMGRGIGRDPTRGMELGLELTEGFEDAALGITRGIVTSSYDFEGHVERYTKEERQIGETGQVVEPDLYIAAGVSGAIQHKVGMDESDTIVAINTDADADVRDFSDYFVEGDLFEVIPALVDAIEAGEMDLKAVADGGVSDD
ncbi:electron transfer flavoprotein subunit alpha [Halobacteriales archaeon QS_8_69_26]|nr:MAG: electron transfer flavoprotein subunit alpha [Halobacteriales archaeon QS_8_69_26]